MTPETEQAIVKIIDDHMSLHLLMVEKLARMLEDKPVCTKREKPDD